VEPLVGKVRDADVADRPVDILCRHLRRVGVGYAEEPSVVQAREMTFFIFFSSMTIPAGMLTREPP
jgi:hypothetical protein